MIFIAVLVLNACKNTTSEAKTDTSEEKIIQPTPKMKYGYDYNLYQTKNLKLSAGTHLELF